MAYTRPSRSSPYYHAPHDPDGDLSGAQMNPSMQSLNTEDRSGNQTPSNPNLSYGDYNGLGSPAERGSMGSPMLLKEGGSYEAGGGGGGGDRAQRMASGSPRRKRRRWWLLAGLLLVVAAAVAIPVGVVKSNKSSKSSKNSSGSTSNGGGSHSNSTTSQGQGFSNTNPNVQGGYWYGSGSDNTTMITPNGTFVYSNPYGGIWNAIPFNDSAKCQDDMPALNEQWVWGKDLIQGVNLGGWLTIEPFIVPALFEPYVNSTPQAVDEWTLCENLGDDMAEVIENHYATFITEEDFAMIASAGLNWVRIPIPWWIIDTWEGEPFLEGVGWKYFLQGLEWARKYGIRVNLDFHATPGSQNGYNHSGKYGSINFLMGYMGIANGQRTMNYIQTLAEFISQPQYRNVIQMFEVLNEPMVEGFITEWPIKSFYWESYQMIREITGIGEGNGAVITIHDGFPEDGESEWWWGFLTGADRLFLDQHNYFCFSTTIIEANYSLGYFPTLPCQYNAAFNETAVNFGLMMAGEWSLAMNDCGEFVNNVGTGNRYEGTLTTSPTNYTGSCDPWNDYTAWDDQMKQAMKNMALSQFDSFPNSFFWTWKIGNSSLTGAPINPMWSYSLGLQYDYVPPTPRQAPGFCSSYAPQQGATVSSPATQWSGTYSAWQTGGSGAGTIAPSLTANFSVWPPTSLNNYPTATLLPTYTATGSVITLSGIAPTAYPSGDSSTNPGNGWQDPSATTYGWYTINTACSYADAWSATSIAQPTTSACGAGIVNDNTVFKRMVKPTPAPRVMRE